MNLKLPSNEWISVFKGSLISGTAVVLTYLLEHLTMASFGIFGPIIVGILSILINIVRKYVIIKPTEEPK